MRQQITELHPTAIAGLGRVVEQARNGWFDDCRRHGRNKIAENLRELSTYHPRKFMGQHALQHAGFDQSTHAVGSLLQKGCQNTGRGGLCTGMHADLQRGKTRPRTIRKPGKNPHAARACGNQVLIPRVVGTRALATISADVAKDEMRMTRMQTGIVQPFSLQRSIPPVANQYICTGTQIVEGR